MFTAFMRAWLARGLGLTRGWQRRVNKLLIANRGGGGRHSLLTCLHCPCEASDVHRVHARMVSARFRPDSGLAAQGEQTTYRQQ